MKRILYDLSVCQPIGSSKFHGAGVYGCIVFTELVKRKKCEVFPYFDSSKFIDESVLDLIREYKLVFIDKKKVELSSAFEKYNIGYFYSPLFSASYETLYNKEIKGLITIHGLRELEMNRDKNEYLYCTNILEFFKAFLKKTPYYSILEKKYRDSKAKLFNSSNFQIITITDHSKYSIINYYPYFDDKNITVRMSPASSIESYEKVKPYNCDKYYLIISAGRWVKNAYKAIRAFDNLVEKGLLNNSKLIVVGLSKKTIAYKTIHNKNRVKLLDYVSRMELESLYKGAYALLYPSLNEGLGDPPLEAMKFGTPVVTSSFGAISEVCGDAVLYANPYSEEEIGIRLLELENPLIYNEYCGKAKARHSIISKKQHDDLIELV